MGNFLLSMAFLLALAIGLNIYEAYGYEYIPEGCDKKDEPRSYNQGYREGVEDFLRYTINQCYTQLQGEKGVIMYNYEGRRYAFMCYPARGI